ncbi:MAG: cytochrome d ubiquinol oxidase subunit II [Candidatus Endobugula sp.]|jgi:cytochrome d ubiquinol oxidase subunit II
MNENYWLPVIFIGLTGLAIVVYAILDGYDLGVGILLPHQKTDSAEQQRDRMIASIGPFWDANETWLVLAVGLILIAFPSAHNIILKELYLPATIMLCSLILRGVAFDFRAKVATAYRKQLWDRIFTFGSLITALSQGYMLGFYVVGFEYNSVNVSFAIISAFCVTAAYTYIGGAWLIMKTEGALQTRAVYWSRRAGWLMAAGILLVTIVNLWSSDYIINKWLNTINGELLLLVPIACAFLFVLNERMLLRMEFSDSNNHKDTLSWLPFCNAAIIFLLCFIGLAFSFYPFVIPQQLTIWQAASASESLSFLLWGAIFVIPAILFYTAFSYRVFWGKAKALDYY